MVCAFDAAVQWMNGAVDRDASAELDGEALLRSGEAVFAAFHELDAGALLKNDELWICAFGEAFLKMSSGHGLVASVGGSPQMSGGPGIVVTGGASRQKNDGLGLGGASLLKNGGAGFSSPDGFGRFPQQTDIVGWGGMLAVVMAGVEVGLNETDVGGDDSGESVAAAFGASCTEDGWRGEGWSLKRGVVVMIGATVGEEGVTGLSAVLAG